tara:strand:- start:149 stop:286 length:138 start_codon:yes stop_codon:yes gene_type:complete
MKSPASAGLFFGRWFLSLAALFPHIAKEWHPTKNKKLNVPQLLVH